MENEVQVFENNGRGISLPVKEVDGQVYFEAEAAAIGLGISQLAHSGNEVVRWERVNKYLGIPTSGDGKIGKGDWITEPQFYKLAFKASNDVADKFQDWVATEVLPSIRKHGAYMTQEKIEEALLNPDTIIKLAQELKREREGRLIAEQQVNELTPKASYYDLILQNKTLMTITQIAKDYGMSGEAMNKKLHELKVIYKGSNVWLLYSKYQDKGWTQSTSKLVNDGKKLVFHTKWTQKGRLGLYELLKQHEILPLIEREDEVQEAQS